MQLPFFVYGTLKPGGSNYARYLAGRTAQEVPACLAGAALFSPGPFPFLTQEPDLLLPGDRVEGTLVGVLPAQYAAALSLLDKLEGYRPGASDNLYERCVTQVESADGPRRAWVYVAAPKALRLIRAGRMRRILGGVWTLAGDA
jgi:gamma-glutamylcyclotransferase (GGCT)/AIG2-like uncharacterized protein YtfP